jgi:hypothetical protein
MVIMAADSHKSGLRAIDLQLAGMCYAGLMLQVGRFCGAGYNSSHYVACTDENV